MGQLGQLQAVRAAQGVLEAGHHLQLFAGQALVLELDLLGLVRESADHQVDLAFGQPDHELVAALFQDLEHQQRPQALDLCHRSHQQVRGRTRDRADRQVSVAALPESIEFIHELAMPCQRHAGIAQREQAQLVGSHATRQPVEQARLQDLLDVHQDLGRRRLRDVHLLGGEPQIAGLAEDVQELQMPESQSPAGLGHGQGSNRKSVWTHKRLESILAKT